MMKKILLCIAGILFSAAAMAGPAVTTETGIPEAANLTTQISNSLSANERRVRAASVRVNSRNGHGTGGLIKYKDFQLVLTAHHVVDGNLGQSYLVSTDNEQQWSILVYKDALNDIAILYLPDHFEYTQPMRYRPRTELIEVGQDITYSGYPSWHSLLSFRGHVAGFETHPEAGQQIILQTYGWFGCSGSVIYDPDGKIIGILWAVDVERQPSLQVQENIVWVSPIQNLNMQLALEGLCSNFTEKPRACR
jgi:S1-C subfamily serine protease